MFWNESAKNENKNDLKLFHSSNSESGNDMMTGILLYSSCRLFRDLSALELSNILLDIIV